MLKPAFVDLSHHNTIIGDSYSAALSSLMRMKDSGIVGLIHKATEGTTYRDDMLKFRTDLCRDAGLLFGTYHFLRTSDMGQQVAHYFDTVQSVQKEPGESSTWLFVCDYEDPGVNLGSVADFCEQLDAVTGTEQHPILYTGFALKDKIAAGQDASRLTKYQLWLAHYTSGAPTLPKGWTTWWGHQYTDKGSVPGIQAPTDVNAYDGSAEDLKSDWRGGAVANGGQPVEPPPEGGVTPEEGEHPKPKPPEETAAADHHRHDHHHQVVGTDDGYRRVMRET